MSSGWDGRASGNTLTFGPHSDVNISLIDGAAGVGGGATDNFSTDIFVSLAAGDVSPRFGDEFALIPEDEPHSGAEKPISNRRGTVWNTTLVGLVENMKLDSSRRSVWKHFCRSGQKQLQRPRKSYCL